MQWRAARHQRPDVRRCAHERGDGGGRVADLLEIVQHEQEAPVREALLHALALAYAQDVSDRRQDERRVA